MGAAELSRDELVERVLSWASRVACGDAELLVLVGELEARRAWAQDGARSCAHWLSWKVGWSDSTARERVRVAVALRELPLLAAELRAGRVSYSQVRAISRVATAACEASWLELARYCTGEQLARAVRGAARARAAERPVTERPTRPAVTVSWDPDGDLLLSVRVPAYAAVPVLTALEHHQQLEQAERDQQLATLLSEISTAPAGAVPGAGAGEEAGGDAAPAGADAGAEIDLSVVPAAAWLDPLREYPYAEPPYPTFWQTPDWHKNAEQLAAEDHAIQAWRQARDQERAIAQAWNSRREQLLLQAARQRVSTEPATLADALVRLVLHPGHGAGVTVRLLHDPLSGWARTPGDELLPPGTVQRLLDALPHPSLPQELGRYDQGRRSRLITPALRWLLGAVDGERCRFPGCSNTRWLHAHHVIFWEHGGRTDLANMILLCSAHHQLLHEHGHHLTVHPHTRALTITTPDGRVLHPEHQLPGATAQALPTSSGLDRQYQGDPYDLGYIVNVMLQHTA